MRRTRLWIAGALGVALVAALVGGPLKKPALTVRNAHCFGWSVNDTGPRLVTLGDSMAQGNSRVDWGIHGNTSWYSYLVCGDDARAADGGNLGINGATTTQILARTDEALAANPDILVVNGGTNDLARSVPLPRIIDNLRTILDRARDVDTVVIATVPSSRTVSADDLNDDIRALAAERGIPVAEFAPLLGRPGATFDGVHPTASTAAAMAAAVVVAVGRALPRT
ncbi:MULTISPECIES: SGNH/GDSL hydrolase family protein [Rhodococcus]|uniref:GDSL-type esterase/lipase family protein n=1 Tax=Rhodococcus cercidiphylli TaxID=489916 RepID=A0ABU4AVX2_9NOCA|nr:MULTISPECIES: GDSL-type esterase/lipase family protein [Rhodococcus]MDV6230377.1 GDSL-type esterase/lipase family protein [Rhodococcus cercidiphylli]MDV7991542.1 GDSL-type esterase/lipase family protein [Rhodococcus sp. IEGM 1374]